MTVNKYDKTEDYPLPHIEDLFVAQELTKMQLDLANAYLQLPLEDMYRQYVTLNTHKELFQIQQAPPWPPAIFQRRRDEACGCLL